MKPPFDQSLIAKGGSLALLSVYHDRVVHHFNSSNSFPITIGMTCVYTVAPSLHHPSSHNGTQSYAAVP
jgi:hypothetical protein